MLVVAGLVARAIAYSPAGALTVVGMTCLGGFSVLAADPRAVASALGHCVERAALLLCLFVWAAIWYVPGLVLAMLTFVATGHELDASLTPTRWLLGLAVVYAVAFAAALARLEERPRLQLAVATTVVGVPASCLAFLLVARTTSVAALWRESPASAIAATAVGVGAAALSAAIANAIHRSRRASASR